MKKRIIFIISAVMLMSGVFTYISVNKNNIVDILDNVEALSGGETVVRITFPVCYKLKENGHSKGLGCTEGTSLMNYFQQAFSWGSTTGPDGKYLMIDNTYYGDPDEVFSCATPDDMPVTIYYAGYCWEAEVHYYSN